jgi:hypothetical protein
MGFRIVALCGCGYRSEFRVGGTQSSFRTECYFPHYCEKCGLVSVNVAREKPEPIQKEKLLGLPWTNQALTVKEPLCCPECQSPDIKQYGKKPMTRDDQPEAKIRSFDHYMDTNNNFCPCCKLYTLHCDIAAFVD